MFTSITFFKAKAGEGLLPSAPHFLPCEPTQAHAIGFVGPRTSVSEGEPINLIETVAGHKIMAVMIESKRVPAEAVQRRLDELVVAHEPQIPPSFMVAPPPPALVPDKAALKAALKAGKDIPGARLARGQRVEIKV